jgi:hypothetical protein
MHDESVRRTTNYDDIFAGGIDNIGEMDNHEIRRLSLKKGGPVPSLYDVLHGWAGGEVFIHVKDFRSIYPVTELLHGMDDDRFHVVSDAPVIFAALQGLLPGRCPVWYPNLGPIAEGPSRGCSIVFVDWWNRNEGRVLINQALSETNMKVWVYNADRPYDAKRDFPEDWLKLVEMEPHGILTAYPEALTRWLHKRLG